MAATLVFVPAGSAVSVSTTHTPQRPGKWLAPFWEMSAAPGGTDRCLYVHCCWPCASGDIATRVGRSYFCDCVFGGLIGMYYCFYGIPWSFTRTAIRHRDGIPGSCVEDCIAITCCPCCYLAQALNHLDLVDDAAAVVGRMPGPVVTVGAPASLPEAPHSATGAAKY